MIASEVLAAAERVEGTRRSPAFGGPSFTPENVRSGSPVRRSRFVAVPVKLSRPRAEPFCHAPRASITSAAPTTLTQPTHDLGAGAARLTCSGQSLAEALRRAKTQR